MMLSVLDAFHVSPRYPCVDPTTPHGQGAPAQPPDTPRYHACTAGITLTSMLQSHQGVQPDFFLCHHVPGCWKAAKNGPHTYIKGSRLRPRRRCTSPPIETIPSPYHTSHATATPDTGSLIWLPPRRVAVCPARIMRKWCVAAVDPTARTIPRTVPTIRTTQRTCLRRTRTKCSMSRPTTPAPRPA